MFGKEALVKHVERLIAVAEKIKAAAEHKTDWGELGRMDQLLASQLSQIEKQLAVFCK